MSSFVWEADTWRRVYRCGGGTRDEALLICVGGQYFFRQMEASHMKLFVVLWVVISEKNIDSLLLLPFKEKGGVFRRCFPFYWDQISNKNAIWTNIVTLILKKLTQANCLQLIESCSPLHNKGRCGYSIVRKVSWNFKGATLIKLQPASNLIMSFPIFQLIMRHHSGKQPLSE